MCNIPYRLVIVYLNFYVRKKNTLLSSPVWVRLVSSKVPVLIELSRVQSLPRNWTPFPICLLFRRPTFSRGLNECVVEIPTQLAGIWRIHQESSNSQISKQTKRWMASSQQICLMSNSNDYASTAGLRNWLFINAAGFRIIVSSVFP